MKSSLYPLFSILFAFFTICIGDLKASQDCTPAFAPLECPANTEIALMPTMEDSPCYAPEWCNAYNISYYSCTWSWASCYGANSYSLQWRYPGGSWYNLPGVCYQTWINVYDLNPCTNYEYRVRANCSNGYYSPWSYHYAFTTECYNYCETPHGCYTSNISQNGASFHWNAVWGAQGYQIQVQHSNGSWYYLPENPCYNNYVWVNNLEDCTYYNWRVRSYCGYNNYSDWTYSNYFTTLCNNYCETPHGCYTSNISQHGASFHWNSVWGAQGYQIQVQHSNGSWYYLPENPCYNNYVWANDLEACTYYNWRVRAYCGYNNYSDWTYSNYFTTSCYYECYEPDWLECYNITGYSATWKWAYVYGADYYCIEWRYPGGSWNNFPGGYCYGTWVDVNWLTPCTTYEWRVKSYCHYGGWSNWCYHNTFTTSCNQCPVPTNLITKDIGDNKATFKWSPVWGASSYSVQLKDAWGTWHDVSGSPTTGTWITVYGLASCKSYEWRVRANCHYESHSYWSKPKQFTTTCGNGCNAPQWVYTNGITPSSATLHWSEVSGADYYVVEWRPVGGTWVELQVGSNTHFELTGLQSNVQYEWHVKAHCQLGVFSPWSSTTYFSTSGHTCGVPMFRYTLPITDSTATFNWSAVNGAVNYTVQIRKLNDQWQDVLGSPTTGTSITAVGLLPNTQYEWRMQVNCSNGGYSAWMSAILFTTGNTNGCPTPHDLYVDNLTLTSATLHWSDVAGDSNYSVQIRIPGGTWNPVSGSPVDTNFINVDGLSPFTTYEFQVRANCPGGYHSFWSVTYQFTTTNIPPCNPPSGLTTTAITETTATLSWSPADDALEYETEIRLPNGTWIDVSPIFNPDTFVVATGLTPNTSYEWRVRTKCTAGNNSSWSASASFTTLAGATSNDECAGALLLTVETSCVTTFATNVDATASTPAPSGGCNSINAKDVWFKFTMPDVPNPTVTIRTSAGSLGNAVMEVYTGTDCSVMSVIACEDNNDNGNGSSMPVINLTGTPNATIWVRVWGYEGSTGTFTICVFNYISFNHVVLPYTEDPAVGESLDELENAVSITMDSENKPTLHLSPNPVSDMLDITVQQTDECRVIGLSIMDLSGKMMLTQKTEPVEANQFKTAVDVSTLVPGMYVLQVQTTSGVMAEKVSVMR